MVDDGELSILSKSQIQTCFVAIVFEISIFRKRLSNEDCFLNIELFNLFDRFLGVAIRLLLWLGKVHNRLSSFVGCHKKGLAKSQAKEVEETSDT